MDCLFQGKITFCPHFQRLTGIMSQLALDQIKVHD